MDSDHAEESAQPKTASTPLSTSHPGFAGSVAGAAGAGVALGFGELIEGATETIPSLVIAVGELIADYTPGDVIAASIANVGSIQKTLLTGGIVVASLLVGAWLGRMAARGHRNIIEIGFALFGVVGGWAAARNPFSPVLASWVVALSAAGLGLVATRLLVSRITAHTPADRLAESAPSADRLAESTPSADRLAESTPSAEAADATDAIEQIEGGGASRPRVGTRRAFFAYSAGAGATALAMVGIGRSLRGPSAAEQAREAVVLPPPTTAPSPPTTVASSGGDDPSAVETPASPEPASLSVRDQVSALDTLDDEVAGISPYISPNDGFYRIDTALVVPQVDPANWSLRFTGMVDNPYELTFDDILAMDLSEHVITLSCVSNRVGGNLVGNAVWTGVPLAELLDRAGVQPGADQVVGRSVDDWTAGFPTGVVHDGRNAILAVGMNGEPLPTRHGFPARLVVAGLYGYVSAVKWIEEISLATWDGFDGYWVPRGWSKEGPMKTQSRIDVPSSGGDSGLVAGQPTPIAGIAWAPTRGIEAVEVNVDGEGWQPCELGEALGDESWVQWHREWTPTGGRHRIQVRATDGDGVLQPVGPKDPRPDGAEGYHLITVNVSA